GRAGPPDPGRADDRGLVAADQLGAGAEHPVQVGRRQRRVTSDQSRLPDRRHRRWHHRVGYADACPAQPRRHRHAAPPPGWRAGCLGRGGQRVRVPHRQRLLLLRALIDAGWFLGYILILLAARTPTANLVAEEAEAADHPEGHAATSQVGLLLPYVAVAGSLVVGTVAPLQHGRLGPFAGWIRSFIMLALIGRQVLTLLENSSLARHLEARVIERTTELRASEQRSSPWSTTAA